MGQAVPPLRAAHAIGRSRETKLRTRALLEMRALLEFSRSAGRFRANKAIGGVMKRLLLGMTIVFGAAVLGGCPIYSTSGNYRACGGGQCFDCPSGSVPSDGTCVPWGCSSSSDCAPGSDCIGGSCQPAPQDASTGCGAGCPSGYICKLSGGQAQCVPVSLDAGRGSDAMPADGGPIEAGPDALSDAPPPDATSRLDASVDASNVPDVAVVSDASDASDASPPRTSCNANSACTGAGAKCIDGQCTPQSHLCSDSTQCVVSGEACVDGVCEPHCSAGAPCPAGFECDFTRGACNLNPNPCVGSGASSCQGGSTCVEGHCVAPCAPSDASNGCPAGQVCANGGCLPDEAARFACKNDGQIGPLATTCSPTEICVHHDCYAGCDPDAGAAACSDPAAICKQVTVAAGTYLVCAASSSLGSDCDPAAGSYCAAGVCIDGFCR